MKDIYLVITKDNKFVGVDLSINDNLELNCLWHFSTREELENNFKNYKIMSQQEYINRKEESK